MLDRAGQVWLMRLGDDDLVVVVQSGAPRSYAPTYLEHRCLKLTTGETVVELEDPGRPWEGQSHRRRLF